MLVFEERGKPEYPEKNLLEQGQETNNKLSPHMMPSLGVEPGPHWWEASALTTAPSLPSLKIRSRDECMINFGIFSSCLATQDKTEKNQYIKISAFT